jgi:thymidine kinase
MEKTSELEIVLGTMFSGKTTYLMTEISKYAEINLKILYINIYLDNRSEINYSSHNPFFDNTNNFLQKEAIKNNVIIQKTDKLISGIFFIDIDKYDLIIIDEAQFFDDLIEFTNLCLEKGKFIIVAGLQADSKGKKFGKILDLIPICSDIKRLHAYCKFCADTKKCKKAIYSKKIINTKKKVDIGGSEKYIPVCFEHYNHN